MKFLSFTDCHLNNKTSRENKNSGCGRIISISVFQSCAVSMIISSI